jgi:1,2-dihydroxy-3-keto-5-methylthiopentene dioxygenase
MTLLQVMPAADAGELLLKTVDPAAIAADLVACGIRFERCRSQAPVNASGTDNQVISAYRGHVERLRAECGQPNVTVERMQAHEGTPELRLKFLREHYHDENEIWLFADGHACFYLHMADKVCALVCGAGDLLVIPAATLHWFDMGPRPQFCAIRLYLRKDSSFRAKFTGDCIPDRFPRFLEAQPAGILPAR